MKKVRKVTKPTGAKSRRARGKDVPPAAENQYRTRHLVAADYRTRGRTQ